MSVLKDRIRVLDLDTFSFHIVSQGVYIEALREFMIRKGSMDDRYCLI